MQSLKIYIVNAFVHQHSGGSPTGVVLYTPELSDVQMQFIADQTGCSHTAFVFEPADQNSSIGIRFFCPGGEILNCGHGTIAAHYARVKHVKQEGNCVLLQQAKEGLQEIRIIQEQQDAEIFFKQNPIRFTEIDPDITEELLGALRIERDEADLPPIIASPGSNRFIIGIRSLKRLNEVAPDFDRLKRVCKENAAIGCFVYHRGALNPQGHLTARMFAPNIGINEDVVNGNSSGCLGAYLLKLSGQDRLDIQILQGQKFNQQGIVHVKVKRLGEHLETLIGGAAKITREMNILFK